MDWAGLRLKLLAQQTAAGDIVLLFADESECLTHPYLAHVCTLTEIVRFSS